MLSKTSQRGRQVGGNKMRQTLVVLLATLVVQVVSAHSQHQHDHETSAAPQQQVDAGKIHSPQEAAAPEHQHEHKESEFIDLSHPLHNGTLHWPLDRGIQVVMDIDEDSLSPSGEKYHVRTDSVNMSIHTGTHLDAPSHFAKDGWTVDKIPLNRLMDVPLTVIDLSEKVKLNRAYSFVKADFMNGNEPLVRPESVVLVYTGISEFYNQGYKGYTGTEKNSSIALMKSPGFSKEAAEYLVAQGVYGVGLDAISADSSDRQADPNKYDPQAHVAFNTNQVYILENVSNKLKELVGVKLARLNVAPLPVVGGTGSPVRVVAMIGHDNCHCPLSNGSKGDSRWSILTMLSTLLVFIMQLLI